MAGNYAIFPSLLIPRLRAGLHAMTPTALSTANNSRQEAPVTAAELSAAARRLYTDGPLLRRKLQHWRPYICPFERLIRHVPQGARILDIGCGGGLFLGLLAERGRLDGGCGLGFDISAGAIETARRMLAGSPRMAQVLEFRVLAETEPWPEGRFDIVSMVDVMHHIPPQAQQRAFAEAASRLAPGGHLLYKDMAAGAGLKTLANRAHDLLLARQWIHHVAVDVVESWAGAAGLRLTHGEDIQRLWYAHELRIFHCPE